ncbi:hypothetical protein [Shouchella miscanthi]|uniref:hypothetical protein n=1 Tax=Shouchella miscanthi TaxID=2598861 RepID=UPI001FEB40ED|nr:hypothetical protein [Shouchella miscanthi]
MANSKVGILLVTPAMLRRLLIPIVHDTTYEALRDVSLLLGSRSGLDTAEEPLADLAVKLAELDEL